MSGGDAWEDMDPLDRMLADPDRYYDEAYARAKRIMDETIQHRMKWARINRERERERAKSLRRTRWIKRLHRLIGA